MPAECVDHTGRLVDPTRHLSEVAPADQLRCYRLFLRVLVIARAVPDDIPILVRIDEKKDFASLLGDRFGERSLSGNIPGGVVPFGMLETINTCDIIMNQTLDTVARQIFQFYENAHGDPNSPRPWDRILEWEKTSKRSASDTPEESKFWPGWKMPAGMWNGFWKGG